MVVQIPPAPPAVPDSETEAGVIEDARARQRRHRRVGLLLLALAVAFGALIAGLSGGGGGSGSGGRPAGQPSGSGAGGPGAHAGASEALAGAPSTQAGGYGVETGACPLAAPNRFLPPRSGCVTVRRADANGDGRPDLILLYSHLSHHHPSPNLPPSLQHDFLPQAAFLKVVLAGGASYTTRLTDTKAAAIASIAHVDNEPGKEIFLEIARLSSGATAVAYAFMGGRLISAGIKLGYGGDSATTAGFNCLPGRPPHLIYRTYDLLEPSISGAWKETETIYAWHGPRAVKVAKRTFTRHGQPTPGEASIGSGCTKGIA